MGSSVHHQQQQYKEPARESGVWENATTTTTTTESHLTTRSVGSSRDWQAVHSELRWSWELHVYVTASLFSVLAVLCLLAVLRLRAQLSHSRNLASLNLFLGILSSARLVVLFLDPYGSKMILPTVMLQVLWDLGYPCLVSAFCLLQLSAVRDVSRLNESTASIVITFHFCLIITSGVLGAVQNWLRLVWIVIQSVFIVWGGFLFLSTLLGCLRILRSMVKVPLRFLTQVDPGCEVNNIVPLGMFTDQSPSGQQQPNHHHHHHNPPHHPRIHITDVDENTYSYASDASLAARRDLQRSESLPMRNVPASSPVRPHPKQQELRSPRSPDRRHRGEDGLIDPGSVRPLIERTRRYTVAEHAELHANATTPATIFKFDLRSPKHSPPRSLPSIFAEDIQKDTRKLKHPSRGRLRHLVFTSALGIALCLLRAYDVFGLDGLMACGNSGPVLQWFFFQTFSRFVEITMAFAIVCGSQQAAASNRYYYYRN